MPENAPSARLVVVQGDASRREVAVESAVVMGRGDDCDLVLLDGACSRRHARVALDGEQFRLVDLDSTNGTFLNGKRVRDARLTDNDEIAFGGVRVRFRAASAGETLVVGARPARPGEAPAVEVPAPSGRNAAYLAARALAERAANSDLPVLLRGETGTGKEVFAYYIHARSRRAAGPWVVLHAAALPSALLEAELFGHERGAFTGADARREGFIARAHGGTLFLDEVGELPQEAQVKLLRVLETGEYHPVGATAPRRSDFRLLAATNRDLGRAVRDGAFRSDLLFRLNALQIDLPALRDRADDLALLAENFLKALGRRPAADLADALRARSWPGNVRELHHALARAALVSDGEEVRAEDLPSVDAALFDDDVDASESASDDASAATFTMDDAEKRAIERALAATGGKRGEAARRLGISEPTLRRKLRRYGLDA